MEYEIGIVQPLTYTSFAGIVEGCPVHPEKFCPIGADGVAGELTDCPYVYVAEEYNEELVAPLVLYKYQKI